MGTVTSLAEKATDETEYGDGDDGGLVYEDPVCQHCLTVWFSPKWVFPPCNDDPFPVLICKNCGTPAIDISWIHNE